jgi:hypothetical protein
MEHDLSPGGSSGRSPWAAVFFAGTLKTLDSPAGNQYLGFKITFQRIESFFTCFTFRYFQLIQGFGLAAADVGSVNENYQYIQNILIFSGIILPT